MAALIKNIPINPKNIIGNRGIEFPLQISPIALKDLNECPLYVETSAGQELSPILTEEGITIMDFCDETSALRAYSANALFELSKERHLSITCYGSTSEFFIEFKGKITAGNADYTQNFVVSPGTTVQILNLSTTTHAVTIADIERGIRSFSLEITSSVVKGITVYKSTLTSISTKNAILGKLFSF